MANQIARSNKKYPDIKVINHGMAGERNYETKILSMLASGENIDVFLFTRQFFQFFVTKGLLLSLEPYLKKSGSSSSTHDDFRSFLR